MKVAETNSPRRVTSFALSPRYLQILMADDHSPKKTHSLASLNTIFSAGSPLKADLYDYIRDNIKDVYISNGSGGTDVCSAFIGSCPITPAYAGVIQCAEMGIAIESFSELGDSNKKGEEGDMVITRPFPNMPLGFLGDDENKTRLKAAYFDRFPGYWYHADYSRPSETFVCCAHTT